MRMSKPHFPLTFEQSSPIQQDLHQACKTGDILCLQDLFKQDLTLADLRSANNQALRWACKHGHLAIVKFLLEKGLNREDILGNPLKCACQYGHLAIVQLLLEKGLTHEDIRCKNNEILHYACERKHFDVVQELIFAGQYTPD